MALILLIDPFGRSLDIFLGLIENFQTALIYLLKIDFRSCPGYSYLGVSKQREDLILLAYPLAFRN